MSGWKCQKFVAFHIALPVEVQRGGDEANAIFPLELRRQHDQDRKLFSSQNASTFSRLTRPHFSTICGEAVTHGTRGSVKSNQTVEEKGEGGDATLKCRNHCRMPVILLQSV